MSEFTVPKGEDHNQPKYQFEGLYTNSLLRVIFSLGVLSTALKSRLARAWRYGTAWFRTLITDYGVPLIILVWIAASYAVPKDVASGVPRRLSSPLPRQGESSHNWTVAKDMMLVPPLYIFAAILPAIMAAGLYFFFLTIALPLIYGKMQEVFIEMDKSNSTRTVINELKDLKEAVMTSGELNGEFDPKKHIDAHLIVRVNEQRVTNLCQSLVVGCCLGAIPLIRKIPTSVLWGYFAYMAIDSLHGNQFWERILLLFITLGRRYKVLERIHASFVESVPFKVITAFTIFQIVYLLICFGVTWIPI